MYIPSTLHKKILSHTVFIFNRETKELGSGVFIEYLNSRFIITVEHLINQTDPDHIFIHLGIEHFQYRLQKEIVTLDKKLDLLIFRLKKFESEVLVGSHILPFKIQRKKFREFSKVHRIAVCGFPTELAKYYHNDMIKSSEPYFVTTTPIIYEEWPKEIAETDKNVDKNILLKYGRKKAGKVLNQDQEEIVAPKKPFGMSGGGIWLYKTETENSDDPSYALIGIQTGIYSRSELLVGTLLKDFFTKIKQ